jgi:hypothetical protein
VDESRDSNFQIKTDKFRELFQVNLEEEGVLSELASMVKKSVLEASHKVLIQGDFWHGNMMQDKKREKLMFIDWQFARWSVDVSMDVYFFLLAGALSASGEGPVDQRAKRAFHILSNWRADVIPEYLSAYGKPHGYVLLPQKYGMMLCCVEKAVRSALEFGYRHPDDLMWRYLFAELMNWPEDH